MKKFLRYSLAAAALAVLPSMLIGGGDPDWVRPDCLLWVSQDSKTNELAIADYFTNQYDLKVDVTSVSSDPSDLLVKVRIGSDVAPSCEIIVDCVESASGTVDGRKVSTEQVVDVICYYILPQELKTYQNRANILEIVNEFNVRFRAPEKVYIDRDGDIVLRSYTNMPARDIPIHVEMIFDHLVRMHSGWEELHSMLSEEYDLSS